MTSDDSNSGKLNQDLSEGGTEKVEHKSLLSMLDLSYIKSLLLLVQNLSKTSNIHDVVYYAAKIRADFLVSR